MIFYNVGFGSSGKNMKTINHHVVSQQIRFPGMSKYNESIAFLKKLNMEQLYKQMLDFGEFRAAENRLPHVPDLPGKRFNENAKIGISRGSADLEFLLGKSAIRAPGRRTRGGPFRISITYSNVFLIFKSVQKS